MYKIEKNRLLFHQYYLEVPFSVQTAMQKLQEVTLPDANRDSFIRLSQYIFLKLGCIDLTYEASWWSSVGKNSRN